MLRTISRSDRKGENEGCDHDQAGIGHQAGHLAHTADVFYPVGIGKAQILVQPVAHIVAIQQIGVTVHPCELLFHKIRNGGFARPGQARHPQHHWLLVFHAGMMFAADIGRLPVNILRPAQREMDQPGPHGAVGHLVDQDEPAKVAAPLIGHERNVAVDSHIRHADRVQVQRFGGQMVHRVDIDLILGLRHRRADGLRPQFQPIGTTGGSFRPRPSRSRSLRTGQPLQPGSAPHRWFGPREQSISSLRHSVTAWPATACGRSPSMVTIRAMVDVLPEGSTRTLSPTATLPVAMVPEKPRKIQIRAVHPLHGHAEGFVLFDRLVQFDRFQML